MPTPARYQLFVGVDIAATTFTAVWTSDPTLLPRAVTFDQTPDGFAGFQQRLQATGISADETLVVMEATGSYWVALAVAMHQAGYAVAVINPAQVVQYARSLPRRGKTDALDAQMLTRFAVERQPPVWTPPPQVYHELRQRLVVRDGLVQMRQHARNQRHAVQQWPRVIAEASAHLDAVISEVTTRIGALDREIASVLHNGEWAESASLLESITGIGQVTTAWLLVGTLNFSLCASPQQAAAYVGLVPLAHESGTSVRGRARIGHSGNGRLRTALYLATLTAARYNPAIQPFYDRLRAAGKPMKVARCAAARKLIHVAWAVVTKRQAFDPTRYELKQEQAL